MTKNIIIALLALLLVWFGAVLARVENERYALSLGMCPHYKVNGVELPGYDCQGVETRIQPSWLWHILYATRLL